MKQFGTILGFELKSYFKNKVFIGITLFLVLLIGAVMFFPRLSDMFASDDEGSTGVVELPKVMDKPEPPQEVSADG